MCACDFPPFCTKCTASSLNSFVKARCSFGMMPSRWMLSFKFTPSEKVRQAQNAFIAERLCSWHADEDDSAWKADKKCWLVCATTLASVRRSLLIVVNRLSDLLLFHGGI